MQTDEKSPACACGLAKCGDFGAFFREYQRVLSKGIVPEIRSLKRRSARDHGSSVDAAQRSAVHAAIIAGSRLARAAGDPQQQPAQSEQSPPPVDKRKAFRTTVRESGLTAEAEIAVYCPALWAMIEKRSEDMSHPHIIELKEEIRHYSGDASVVARLQSAYDALAALGYDHDFRQIGLSGVDSELRTKPNKKNALREPSRIFMVPDPWVGRHVSEDLPYISAAQDAPLEGTETMRWADHVKAISRPEEAAHLAVELFEAMEGYVESIVDGDVGGSTPYALSIVTLSERLAWKVHHELDAIHGRRDRTAKSLGGKETAKPYKQRNSELFELMDGVRANGGTWAEAGRAAEKKWPDTKANSHIRTYKRNKK